MITSFGNRWLLNRWLLVAVLLAAAIPGIPARPAAAQDAPLAPSDTILEIRLADGSTLYGRVVGGDSAEVIVVTEAGARVEVARASIRSARPAGGVGGCDGGSVPVRGVWDHRPDPDRRRGPRSRPRSWPRCSGSSRGSVWWHVRTCTWRRA